MDPGVNLKISDQAFRTDVRRNNFTLRVENLWNSPPRSVMDAQLLSIFKTQIDRFQILKKS